MNGVQELTLNNVELRDNTATSSSVSDSGTIYINSSFLTNVTFENVNAINNVSKGNGGVVFFGSSCENADISFIDCELFGNVAEKVGGGKLLVTQQMVIVIHQVVYKLVKRLVLPEVYMLLALKQKLP